MEEKLATEKRSQLHTRPKSLTADKVYDSYDFQIKLLKTGIQVAIPSFKLRKLKNVNRVHRIKAEPLYKYRWEVELLFA